jgi:hypothetical protein
MHVSTTQCVLFTEDLQMAFLASAPSWIGLATTALTIGMAYQQAQVQQAQFNAVAKQRENDANAAAAESQRAAIIERRRAQHVMSRARAVAGASGAGVSDPTVTNILTDIETQGEMNALNALFEGHTAARANRQGAAMARNEARAAGTAGYFGAASTALSGGSSWYEKYGV